MKVQDLRNYGMAFSDAEGQLPIEMKMRMRKNGRAVILGALGPLQKLRFLFSFLYHFRRARKLDLSDLRARGMRNEPFLALQLEYVASFAALAGLLGTERAVQVFKDVMDATAREALLYCLPKPEQFGAFEDPHSAVREYLRPVPAASHEAGCLEMDFVDGESFGFDVKWCVWFELAKRLGVPDACRPNCYADDLVYPEYFAKLGIDYQRSDTLACGGNCCDFRFNRADASPAEASPPSPE